MCTVVLMGAMWSPPFEGAWLRAGRHKGCSLLNGMAADSMSAAGFKGPLLAAGVRAINKGCAVCP